MKTTIASVLIGMAACIATATADTTLTYAGDNSPVKIYITADALRIDNGGDDWALYRQDNSALVGVHPANQSYFRLDRDTASEIRRQLDTLENFLQYLPAQRREQARRLLGNIIPGYGNGAQSLAIERTDATTDDVNGIECRIVQISLAGRQAGTVCLADPDAVDISADDFETVQAMLKLMNGVIGALGYTTSGLPLQELNGVPLRFSNRISGTRHTLKKVEHEPLPESYFKIPAGYHEQKLDIMGIMGG